MNISCKASIIITLCIAISFFLAQAPDTIWTKTFGGSNYEFCSSMQITSDGGYILGAQTMSQGAGLYDFWLIKSDNNGDTLWTRTYGGVRDDMCRAVLQTSDGGYFVAGSSKSFGAGIYPDVYLIKTDSLGDTLWTRTYGGSSWDYGMCLDQTADGGYIISGRTNSMGVGGSDLWLIKTNVNGNMQWLKTYGNTGAEEGRTIHQLKNGGYIVAGLQESPPGSSYYNAYLIRTDINGDTLWTRTYGYSGNYSWIFSLQLAPDTSRADIQLPMVLDLLTSGC